jgi:hypothetical protein
VTKHPKGYEVMKEIMAKFSSFESHGVPSFEYSPKKTYQMSLFSSDQTIDKLKLMLLDYFKGQKSSVGDIYRRHNTSTLYVKSNYKTALLELEEEGIIDAIPPKDKRRKLKGEITLGDRVIIKFPG